MRRRASRTPGRITLAALALMGLLGHAPVAQADPFGGISSLWSLLAPRGRANTQISDVYRKKPLHQPETRMAHGAPVRSTGPSVAPIFRQ